MGGASLSRHKTKSEDRLNIQLKLDGMSYIVDRVAVMGEGIILSQLAVGDETTGKVSLS